MFATPATFLAEAIATPDTFLTDAIGTLPMDLMSDGAGLIATDIDTHCADDEQVEVLVPVAPDEATASFVNSAAKTVPLATSDTSVCDDAGDHVLFPMAE